MFYAVNQLTQAMVRPTKLYWKVEYHVLRYLKGTIAYRLWYRRTKGVKLQGFTNVDWIGSPSYMKSNSSVIFTIRSAFISWYNMKQRYVALISVEVEYMAASQAICESIWMRKILIGIFS